MNATDRERIKDLLDQAARLEPPRRRAFIESAAEGNAEIAAEALDLLHTLDDSFFMSAPTGAGFEQPSAPVLPHEGPGAKIGRYKLLQLVGEGGFGSVFMAEQTDPVHRRVALKIIKAGMDTRQVIARFEAERQALAMMDHPNIARVLDAGSTEAGRPYFVMELVRGEPVTVYCDRRKMTVLRRLELFRDVCHAVQHAHQKGIIHRDLKPSNVLVTVADGAPLPKVIDFGIAKATAARLTDKTLFTEMHQLMGTPEYMSPEQAEISGVDIDTRSDVYSLGVMLYELLAGSTPLERERLRSTPLAEIQRLIREEEPLRPSLRLATLAARPVVSAGTPLKVNDTTRSSALDIARRRQADPSHLTRALRGDLDWIVMKCLEKDRSRRYSTASALADDVGRYLLNQPVLASPPSSGYKLRKFVERNQTMVMAGAAVFIVLVLGVIGTTLGLVWAVREKAQTQQQRLIAEENATKAQVEAGRANREAEQSQAVTEFMREVLTSADSERAGADVRLVEVLADASSSASQRFAEYPLQEAQVRDLLGQVYNNLGIAAEAKKEFHRAAALWKEHVGENDPRSLTSQYSAIGPAVDLAQTDEVEAALPQLLEGVERVFGSEDLRTLNLRRYSAIVECYRGRLDNAERILLELQFHPKLVDNNYFQIRILHNLFSVQERRGSAMGEAGRRALLATCEPIAREMHERAMLEHGADARITLRALIRLAEVSWAQGDFRGAIDTCQLVLDRSAERLGHCHAIRTHATSILAKALAYEGDDIEAAAYALSHIECLRSDAKNDPITLMAAQSDALIYLERARRAEEGESLARELIAALQQYAGGHGDIVFAVEMYLARFLSMQDRLDEADNIFQSLLAREASAELDTRARMHLFYGANLARAERFAEAEQELLTAVHLVGDVRTGTSDIYPEDIVLEFIALYEAWGETDKAEKYRALRTEVRASARTKN